jgi:WD40 repeat protein
VSDGEYIDRLKSAMPRAEHCVTPEYSETLVAAGSSLAVYSLQDSNGFVTWSRRHLRLSPVPITSVSISASHGVLACSFRKHHIVQIMRYTETGAVTTIAEPWHPRPVRSLAWIEGASPGTQASTTDSECSLLTETEDGIVRVWRCLPDEPDFFVLWHTFNPPTASSSPSICNIWLGDRGLFTVAQDGRASVTRLIVSPAQIARCSASDHHGMH